MSNLQMESANAFAVSSRIGGDNLQGAMTYECANATPTLGVAMA
jgi:hypothetical protein